MWGDELAAYIVYHARSACTSDGGFMTVGSLGSDGETVPPGFSTRVWKWDSMGNLMWTHDWSWGSSSSSMRPDLHTADDGYTYVHSIRGTAPAQYMHVARFESTGIAWEDSFAVSSGSMHFVGRNAGFGLLHHVPDSLYLTQDFEIDYYDLNGTLEFSSISPIVPMYNVVIEDVASHPDGETGVLFRGETGPLTTYINHVLRIDAYGAVLGQTGLSEYVSYCACESLHANHDGGFVASGIRIPGLFGSAIPCLFKTDANGNIARSTLNGYLYVDENGNNNMDVSESSVPGIQLNFLPEPIPSYSSSVGYYARNFYSLDSVKIQTKTPFFFAQSFPDTSSYAFAPDTLDGGIHSIDIAIQIVESVEEYEIVLIGTNAVVGFPYQSWITCKNRGSVFGDTVFVDYVIPPSTMFVTASPAPFDVEGDTLRFALQFTEYFEDQQIHVVMTLAPDITLMGDTLWSVARIRVPESDYIPSNNTDWEPHRVRAAYDPNQKTVEPVGTGPGYVADTTEWLTYTIEFQNTGNYPASIVRLVDPLPQEVLPESLEFLASSHEPMAMHFENSHTVVWTFDPIFLPDSSSDLLGSMGFVTFRIKPVPNLESGTVIRNKAEIYFDFNPAISTGFTRTIWGIPEFNVIEEVYSVLSRSLFVYPNPTAGQLHLEWPVDPQQASETTTYRLIGMDGRVALEGQTAQALGRALLNVSGLSPGLYTILVDHGGGRVARQKVVVAQF